MKRLMHIPQMSIMIGVYRLFTLTDYTYDLNYPNKKIAERICESSVMQHQIGHIFSHLNLYRFQCVKNEIVDVKPDIIKKLTQKPVQLHTQPI